MKIDIPAVIYNFLTGEPPIHRVYCGHVYIQLLLFGKLCIGNGGYEQNHQPKIVTDIHEIGKGNMNLNIHIRFK